MKGAKGRTILFVVVVLGFVALSYFGIPALSSIEYGSPGEDTDSPISGMFDISIEKPSVPKVLHLPTPEPFKAIYMSQCVAGTPSFRDKLVDLIETTELNSVIIDVKDFSGRLAFPTDNPVLKNSVSGGCGARDMEEFIKRLHESGIYVVGRITVFQDPYYTSRRPDLAVKKASDGGVWKDYKGLSFIDVGARDFWDYIVAISEESYDIGFDELNFDYVRFPSDGNMKDVAYEHSVGREKEEVLEEFFAYLYEKLSDPDRFESGDGPVLSADLFGMTTTNTDDLNIGQKLERALPYFHFVMPMVYPSHYPAGFNGWAKPATKPYEIIKFSMDKAVERVDALNASLTSTSTEVADLQRLAGAGHGDINKLQLRTWLQDFDLGATYTPDMVRTQIQATYDAGLTSWALWDAGNTYTRSALNEE